METSEFANHPFILVKTTEPRKEWHHHTGYVARCDGDDKDSFVQPNPGCVLVYLSGYTDHNYKTLLGIDPEHLDIIGSFEDYARDSFSKLAKTDDGFILLQLAKVLWKRHGDVDNDRLEMLRASLTKSRAYEFPMPK